jgi:ribose transport system ATP-binding protein
MSLLQVKELDKKFGNHDALSKFSLTVEAGEIHALVGENGAGKSTFIKILTGVYSSDGGQLIWSGQPVEIDDPIDAGQLGIHVVHQDRHLIPFFTGYENLYLGREYPKRFLGLGVNWKAMKEQAEALKEKWGIQLDLQKTVSEMTPPEKTMLEILKAMMEKGQLLILDEPTASLTDQETRLLFKLIRHLAEQGTAIIYVSHRMDEIFQLADRITVLQNGQVVGTKQTVETHQDQIIAMMTKGEVTKSQDQRREVPKDKPILLKLTDVATKDQKVKKANLVVREGEIVGVFGLAGSGRTEMLEAIYGTRKISQGTVQVAGKDVQPFSPKESLKRGVVLIPEDRRGHALIMNMSIRENMTLPVLKRYTHLLGIRASQEKSTVLSSMKRLKVKATRQDQRVEELSGGNQQKVVFAKALLLEPTLFLCDEPTQAVDVMTRAEIHHLLKQQTEQQKGVLYVSSDLKEILEVADRIYVFRNGETVAEFENKEMTADDILQKCF